MPKEMDLVKLNTIKRYVKDVQHMRFSSTAANDLRIRVNAMLKDIISEAKETAKEGDRNTIMPRDLTPAMERIIGRKNLDLSEILQEIRRLGPIDLGKLSKLVNEYIEEEKARRED